MKDKLMYLLLVAIAILPLLDLLQPGLPVTHDGQDHVARIANFYQSLSEGIVVPRWGANLNWGYGHPVLMFLYPLPSYITSLFHVLGFSLVDGIKLVFAVSFVLSSLFMYLWLSQFLDKEASLIGALLYIFAPYRFVDVYVRGAIGEHVAFIFPPLILYFLFKLAKKFSKWHVIGGSLSFAGLILGHNAISLMFFPIIALYAMFMIFTSKKRRLLIYQYTSILVLGLGISAFFWVPAFFEGKYTLRDIVTSKEYASRFVSLQDFLYKPWSYGITGQFSTQLGFIHWLSVMLSIPLAIIQYKKRKSIAQFTIGLLIIFWATLFLMTPFSKKVWEVITTLQKFQFPWRFLTLSVFTAAVLGALCFSQIPKKFKRVAVVFGIAIILFFNKDYWHAKGFQQKPEEFYKGVYHGTTDTGESSPIWSVRFMEKEPNAPLEAIDGDVSIKQLKRTSTEHIYEITANEKVRVRENTLYFPGWQVRVDGQTVLIEFQDPAHRGLMTFFVDEGMHRITVQFKETKLRVLSNAISIITLLSLIIFILFPKKLWQRFQ